MEILKFKTNVTSQDEVNKVTPLLDKLDGISKWQISTDSEENILSISGDNVNPQQVENALTEAGFTGEFLRVLGISGEEL
ncbi:heavy-metal-associated domain-containing protein [Adhaeribacter radiodurans]|uniref:Copper chaperone n=1 Tax=Adhaeribacter radiodurans TaxID=2745197 RepID=A0A7L7LDI6_9BACT|nr:copper chaperone [Adhaeribacter radiodurans]QMU30871.1 copper chaperone [Adhaeribacter radiodurans]